MKRKRQRGSAMVEGALILLVLLLMLIGVVDFGQFLFIHNALAERARSSVRYGAVLAANGQYDATKIQNMVLYGQAARGEATYFNLTTAMVQVSRLGAGTDDERVRVAIVDYPYTVISPTIMGTYYGPNIVTTAAIGMQ